MKIKFKELSFPLKIAVIAAWIDAGIMLISFSVGFIIGALEL